ncbi:MAG TPA: GvpL/GvpF family gas vesicle protein [Thermoleophilaceae bacterium]|nr:GvpL/GvpF family gas vesicle protein [Thermoleophilaceae bacterium]
MIELYAIARHPGPPLPDLAQLRAVPSNGLAALCGPAADEGETTEEALWRHEEIVEALMLDRDLLPVRYGTRLADEQAAADAVAERRGELLAALEHVRGAVELSLRVRARSPGRAPELHALRSLARDQVERPGRDEHELLRAAYLVDRDAVERFSEEVARLQDANPELALLLTGPWPPYSFSQR